jgi:hypothetical protein
MNTGKAMGKGTTNKVTAFIQLIRKYTGENIPQFGHTYLAFFLNIGSSIPILY